MTAAQIAEQLRSATLEAAHCQRVRDIVLTREDVKIYLTDGYLMLASPVGGRRVAAFFTTEVEGGEGEILLMPPNRGERMSLASFTKSPNLNEHFRYAVLIFGDDTAGELLARMRERREQFPDSPGTAPDMGALLAERWTPVVRNLLGSLEVRVVESVLAQRPARENFFYGAFTGKRLGNFDFIYDPHAREQITLGQVAFRDSRPYFDVWASFEARSFRNGKASAIAPDFRILTARVDAEFDDTLRLKAVSRLEVTPSTRLEHVLPFDISTRMTVTEAKVDGAPAEVFQKDSLRATLIRGAENLTFLIVPDRPLEAGRKYQVEIHHEGQIVTDAGNGVYFVGSRSSWLPNRGMQFAAYELSFLYPKRLELVATGAVVEDRLEGERRFTRFKPDAPIRFAGFNLGHFSHVTATQGGFTVRVYGNPDAAPPPRPAPPLLAPPPTWPRSQQRQPPLIIQSEPPPPPGPAARMQQLAAEVAAALEFMAGRFGPPAMKQLIVSPIPGFFGQGFPGLIYLSTLSYLPPGGAQPAPPSRNEQLFFSEILSAHEVAHQWWGNVVATAAYQDDWLMEALASYSALLFLEKRRGGRVLEELLEEYKGHLLSKDSQGRTLESAGPITWGARLLSSQSPLSWRVITYEKGSWIIHMLRRRMGDERFFALLREMCRRYRFQTITTRTFQTLAAEFMPKDAPDRNLDGFFEQWVYGTGIPTLKFTHSVKGKAPLWKVQATIAQSDVPEEFGVWAPVEVQFARGAPLVRWVETGNEPVTITLDVKQPPVRVQLDPRGAVLAKKN